MPTPTAILVELQRLSKLRPVGWNEADVREDFIAPLLSLLGYERRSDYDINREGTHLLGRPFLYVGRKRIDIDYALVVRKKSFWIIEAKAADPVDIDEQAVFQAHFYALHPEVAARYFVVCNAWNTIVYDMRSIDETYTPLLTIEMHQLPTAFPALATLLGASRIRTTLRQQSLLDIRKLLETEIREESIQELVNEVQAIGREVRPTIRENHRQVLISKSDEHLEAYRKVVESGTPLQMLQISFEFPETNRDHALVQSAFFQALDRQSMQEREETIGKIGSHVLRSRPTTAHRRNVVRLVLALLRRWDAIVPDCDAAKLREEARWSIKLALNDYSTHPLYRALWELEGNLFRVLYKSTFVLNSLGRFLSQIVEQKKQVLQEEDLVYLRPSTASERVSYVSDNANLMYHRLCCLSHQRLEEINQAITTFEASIEAAFEAAYEKAGRSDLSFYAVYNKPFDYGNSGLLETLTAGYQQGIDVVDDEIVKLVEKKLRQRSSDYAVNYADEFLVRWHASRGNIELAPTVAVEFAQDICERFQRMHVARCVENYECKVSGRVERGKAEFVEYVCLIDVDAHCVRVTSAKYIE